MLAFLTAITEMKMDIAQAASYEFPNHERRALDLREVSRAFGLSELLNARRWAWQVYLRVLCPLKSGGQPSHLGAKAALT